MPVWSAPVRHSECDQHGVGSNADHILYAGEAAEHLWRQVGVSHPDLIEQRSCTSVVASESSWSSSARWGDVIEVDGAVERVGRTSSVTALTIPVRDGVGCRVQTTYVITDLDRRPTPVPPDVRALLWPS